MEGLVLYICITIIPWVGLAFRIYDISKGNFDPKDDPKTLTLLSIWAIGFTIFWILIGGFGASFAPYCGRWIPC
mgnify:FL=1|jgi:hypothetical protein